MPHHRKADDWNLSFPWVWVQGSCPEGHAVGSQSRWWNGRWLCNPSPWKFPRQGDTTASVSSSWCCLQFFTPQMHRAPTASAGVQDFLVLPLTALESNLLKVSKKKKSRSPLWPSAQLSILLITLKYSHRSCTEICKAEETLWKPQDFFMFLSQPPDASD